MKRCIMSWLGETNESASRRANDNDKNKLTAAHLETTRFRQRFAYRMPFESGCSVHIAALMLFAVSSLLWIVPCHAQSSPTSPTWNAPTWPSPSWPANSPSWANAPSFGRQQVTPSVAQTPERAPYSDSTSSPTIVSNETFSPNEKNQTMAPTNYTDSPTPQPTVYTTSEPTYMPTGTPTIALTTVSPTNEPTVTQTEQPTVSFGVPTYLPTLKPTPRPTNRRKTPLPTVKNDDNDPTPSEAPVSSSTESQTVDLVLLLQSVSDLLDGETSDSFDSATARYIETSILQQQNGVDSVSVVVTRLAQRLITTVPSNADNSQRRLLTTRVLQSDASAVYPLQVITTAEVNYKLNEFESMQNDPNVWVSSAFNSQAKRDAYTQALQATNDPYFNPVNEIGVKVDGATPAEETDFDGEAASGDDEDNNNNNQMLGIIIGSALGGVAVLGLGFLGYRKFVGNDDAQVDPGKAHSLSGPSISQHLAFQTEILVDGQRADDISTLGDLTMWGHMAVSDGPGRDERTASLGDYDYAKQFLQQRNGSNDTGDHTHSVSESNPVSRVSSSQSGYSTKIGLPPMNASVFSDDASFEQQFADGDAVDEKFEIKVPPGKLGMVIDTPNGDVPIVHAIKSESILYDQVKVGDRLLSVNGIDVSSMTALQVSKLISLKADQHRVLNFHRSGPLRER
ncbi:hypothetical protein MPSEU_000929500 [Mayamaea pseudoterrestris]|nr:hypothetical protein MPSEU_000929500 [Mayamaea pseudoterrestris]